MRKVISGSCLCGGVRFEVDPPFIQASHCHCERCRKHSGTAVCTQARVFREHFRLVQGKELIKIYGKGEGAVKAFCSNCGSSLFGGDWPVLELAGRFPQWVGIVDRITAGASPADLRKLYRENALRVYRLE